MTGLDADRILRSFLGMIGATLRTNYYRERPFLSFKIDPSAVPDMPAPRPRFEIFVYSPRVEGVHLRYGAVARGGLRWSDRPQDFRTEILGLVKAQAVKNAVIVPVGAKGGFVVRRPEAGNDEVVACYKTFISGLLDVTDNLVVQPDGRSATVPPPDVVRHDGDDAYLVVAADKGTAKFSDIANEVAASYGFWLGDAFASGGSVGYDHKAMGITARGAWESVKRHFRELGVDTQAEEFTVVGIGDMSGDVFGNGMLLSPHIRLVAAFDHRHVFVDPDPDAARGFAERQRLFALPRSSWDDYDRDAISAGGGVWPRTAKSVPIGAEIRAALGLDDDIDPAEPARADPGDPARPGGPAVERRHRHLRQGQRGDPRPTRATRPTTRSGPTASELRVKVVGRGRQPGLDPAGPHRVRPQRREDQHRRDRQLGGRRLQRPRGQHQDPARPARRGRRAGPRRAQRAAGRDDRRGRRAGARRQPCPERAAGRRPRAREGHDPRAPAVRRGPRDAPRHRPAAGGAARQGRLRRAGGRGARADRSRAGDARRARQARPARAGARLGPARHRGLLAAGCRSTSRARCASGSPRRSPSTRCAGRSSRPCWSTRPSTPRA